MQRAVLMLTACLILTSATSCGTVGNVNNCTGAIRLSGATIDALTDEEARAILNHNEQQAQTGCAKPN